MANEFCISQGSAVPFSGVWRTNKLHKFLWDYM